MKVDVADIVSTAEIAERTKVNQPAVSNWTKRHPDFPKPIKVLRCGPLYSWKQVDEWVRRTRTKVEVD